MAIGGNYGPPLIDFTPLANLADPIIEAQKRARVGQIGTAVAGGDYDTAMKHAFALGDVGTGLSLLKLKQDALDTAQADNAFRGMAGGISAAPGSTAPIGSAPSFTGAARKMSMPADPATEQKFLAAVKSNGLTNPYGVAALAAHVNAESGFDPANFTRTWSDPSQSGQPGTSGGALSWRGDRLARMQAATQGMDPVEAQAKYALTERPDVTLALQNAKSLEEAHSILANSQRYAGYDRPGGENAKRLAIAQNYLPKVTGADAPAAWAQLADTPISEKAVNQGAQLAQQQAEANGVAFSPRAAKALSILSLRGARPGQIKAAETILAQELQQTPEMKNFLAQRMPGYKEFLDRNQDTAPKTVSVRNPDTGEQDTMQWDKDAEKWVPLKPATATGAAAPSQDLDSKTYRVEQAKHYAETYNEAQTAARTAPQTMGNLNAMNRLLSNDDFYSGTGGPTVTAIKRALVAIGVKDAKTAAPNELFDKLANKALLDASGGKLGAGFSNADREFMGRTQANLSNTKEGNAAIINMAMAVERRKLEIGKMARAYADSHGGRLDRGFEDQLAAYAEANPLFPDDPTEKQGPPVPADVARQPGISGLPPGMPSPAAPAGFKIIRRITP